MGFLLNSMVVTKAMRKKFRPVVCSLATCAVNNIQKIG